MADQGIFTGYDLVIMIHMDNKNRVNARFLALDSLEFTFKGRVSHAAAAPWEGRNALNGVQLMFHAIDMLRQHVQPDTRMHGIIIRGGEACNIVPEEAAAQLYIRACERDYLDRVKNMVTDCAQGSAIATQTNVMVSNFSPSLSDLKPNKAGEMLIGECFQELGLEDESEGLAFGSSDVGNVSYLCPTLHPTLALAEPDVQLHTREFARLVKGESAYKAILTGAKILNRVCLRVFHEPGVAEKIRDDFLRTGHKKHMENR